MQRAEEHKKQTKLRYLRCCPPQGSGISDRTERMRPPRIVKQFIFHLFNTAAEKQQRSHTAPASHGRRARSARPFMNSSGRTYIMVENSLVPVSWINTVQIQSVSIDLSICAKMKRGIQPPLFGQRAEQRDTLMRGLLLLLAAPLVASWSAVTPANTRL